MKRQILSKVFLAALVAFSMTACDDDNDDDKEEVAATDIEYSSDNASSWHNYMLNVSKLLTNDATSLNESWSKAYNGGEAFAATFKSHSGDYKSALNCIEEILDGCADIAGEVGGSKIGDPIEKYESGDKEAALYAVESWYSWHSRDDYSNNIRSIRNSYYGTRDGKVAENSLYKLIEANNAELHKKVCDTIQGAIDAILAIPQPFRNNIVCAEAKAAQTACANLVNVFETLKAYIDGNNAINSNEVLEPIVNNYVDVVVLPTYADLQKNVEALNSAVATLAKTPTNDNFSKACDAWLAAREPWESSEAFLFGPVADLGLDPNMDSWPLDQEAIVNILKSGNWKDLEWSGDYDEESEAIEAAQSVRGFHTLEFLLFKDGKARTVK